MAHQTRCWNCLTSQNRRNHTCESCGQPLAPNPAQRISARSRLDYLLLELQQWTFLEPQRRAEIRDVYLKRKERLQQAGTPQAAGWPERDPLAHLASSVDGPEAAASLKSPDPSPDQGSPLEQPQAATNPPPPLPALPTLRTAGEPHPTPPDELRPSLPGALLGEADIRWFHTLGAVLVLAAVVGWLRTQWDGYGRTLAGLLIASAPFLLVGLGRNLRRSLPLSARLLENLGAFLVAPALLSVDLFDLLPLPLASDVYQSLALQVSAAALFYRGWSTRERLPLMIGGLCAAVSGWPLGSAGLSLGALATGALASGAASYLQLQSREPQPDASLEPVRTALGQISVAAIGFGCFATLFLFGTESHPGVPVSVLVAATLLLALPELLGAGQVLGGSARLALQTFMAVGGATMMRVALELPMPAVALYLLFASALLLLSPASEGVGRISVRLGTALGALGLVLGLLEDALPQALDADPILSAQRLLLAAAGAALFGWHGRRKRFPTPSGSPPDGAEPGEAMNSEPVPERYALATAAALALLGGWCHLSLPFCDPHLSSVIGLYPLLLSLPLFGLLALGAARLLLKPWETEVALVLTSTLLLSLLPVAVGAHLFDPAVELQPWRWAGLTAAAAVTAAALLGFRSADLPPQLSQALDLLAPRLLLWHSLGVLLLGSDPYTERGLALVAVGWLAALLSHLLKGPFRSAAFEAAWLLLGAATVFAPTVFQGPELRLVALLGLYATSVRAPLEGRTGLALAGIWTLPTTIFVGFGQLPPLAAAGIASAYLGACWLEVRARAPAAPSTPVAGALGLDAVLIGSFLIAAEWPSEGALRALAPLAVLTLVVGLGAVGRRGRANAFYPSTTPLTVLLAAQVIALFARGSFELGLLALGGGLLLLLVSQRLRTEDAPETDDPQVDPPAASRETHRRWLTEWSHLSLVLAPAWLLSETSFDAVGEVVLAVALALEGLRWILRWEPTVSPTALALLAVLVGAVRQDGAVIPALLSVWGVSMLVRVLERPAAYRTLRPLLLAGGATLVAGAYRLLALAGYADWRWRLFALALFVLPVGLRLCWRPTHPMIAGRALGPIRWVSAGLLLVVGPWTLQLALGLDQMLNFTWVLGWGCAFLMLSLFWAGAPLQLGLTLRRAGAGTLSAWVLISLGRAAYAISWQAGTLFVGLLCVAVGVIMERRRR